MDTLEKRYKDNTYRVKLILAAYRKRYASSDLVPDADEITSTLEKVAMALADPGGPDLVTSSILTWSGAHHPETRSQGKIPPEILEATCPSGVD
jgi:hypothetical protein